ncbi:subtilisin-like protein [Decorospora gaudefroyi]|uniref:Subtilisin-like protein n=1 Tax=Decorospora gaudefroyi TaxID=184978 RepID=A0A6A5JUX1_9PLEO|nr:subtilisin-like protein [Decorospora gaudefroyi]
MYITHTKLNATQAAEIAQLDFIESIDVVWDPDYEKDENRIPEEFRAINTTQLDEMTTEEPPESFLLTRSFAKSSTNANHFVPRAMGAPDPNAPYWKKMLSAPPPSPGEAFLATDNYPPYLADDTGGAGTTIYILDDGFDTGIPDLLQTPGGRRVDTHFMPNHFSLPAEVITNNRAGTEEIGGPGFHGTIMACLAGGAQIGVAPKANLYLFKVKGSYRNSNRPDPIISHHTHRSVTYWIRHVKEHIDQRERARPAGGPPLKSVINMSWGINNRQWGEDGEESLNNMKTLLQRFLDWCSARGIPVVVAAGNEDFRTWDTNENLPHSMSRDTDSMIIVGAVNARGLVIEQQLPDESGLVHLYSPGHEITTPTGNGNELKASGTSQATAIVVCNLFLYSNSH